MQQNPFIADIAVDQDTVGPQTRQILAMARHALVDQVVIGVDRVLQLDATRAQLFHGREDIVRGHGDVLNAFALVLAQEFLDLRRVVLAFVQGDADGAVGRDHRLAEQAGRLALDVEILLLLEAEDLAVKARPGAHLTAAHIVRQMIDDAEAHAVGGFRFGRAGEGVPIGMDVVVDQVEQGSADAFQDKAAFAEGARSRVGGTGAVGERNLIGLRRIGDAESHAVGRSAVRRREGRRLGRGVAVEQEADVPLFVTDDILRRMPRGRDEPQLFQLATHNIRIGTGKFDEGETV